MDPKDPQSQTAEPVTPGISMAPIFPDPAGKTDAPPSEIPGIGVDTIVIPPAGAASDPPAPASTAEPQPATPNPFIPAMQIPASDAPKPRLSLLRIFLVIGALLFVGMLAVFLVRRMSSPGGSPSGNAAGALGKEVVLNYWGLWENDAVTRQFLSDFESKHPTIKVQYTQQSPKQYRERLQSAINRGEGPDVFRFHNTWIPMLRNQLALVPQTVMTAEEFAASFFPVINNDLVAGTSIFGIPLMIDGLGLYINDALFAAAGASDPATWTDVINLIPKLTVKSGTAIVTGGIALGTTNNVEHFSDILGLMFLQNGTNLAHPTGKEAEGTLIFYRKFADPSDPLYTWSDGMDNSVSAFANGRVAMIIAPSWRAHDIAAMNPKLRFHIAPVPQLQGNNVAWASYWVEGVSSRSKNQQAAWELVKYMTSAEGASKFYTEASKTRLFGEPYARMELASTIQNDPYLGAYVKQAAFARSFPLASRTNDNGLNDKLIQYLTDAVNGMIMSGGSPTQVLATMSQGFRQVFNSYGLTSGAEEPTAAP